MKDMTMLCQQLLYVIFLNQIIDSSSLHVLLIPMNIGSHVITFGRTAELLLEKGHNVTFVISNTQNIPKSVMDIPMNIEYYKMKKEAFVQSAKHRNDAINHALDGSVMNSYALLMENFKEFTSECEEMLSDTDLYHRLQKMRFDIAVNDYFNCPFILPYKLNVPFTILGSDCLSAVWRIPAPPSYLPRNWHPLPFTESMSFLQRLLNFLAFAFDHLSLLVESDKLVVKYAPNKEPITGMALYRQAKLCFKIKPNVVDFARPINPNIIPLGNLMTRPPKELPKDLLDFVSDSKHGVIILCFGSWMTSLPYATALKFFEAFSQIKQRVIWKYHGKVPDNASSNIKINTWLPQNALLGHPNTKLFMYHGGTAGIIESVYHRVPMIIMPLFIDQTQNAAIVESKLFGMQLNLSSFSSNELVNAIKQVIGDSSYKASLKAAAAILRDPVAPAADTLDYWLNHVVKHGDKHLRVYGLEMSLFQLYSLDVILVLTFMSLLSLFTVYKLFVISCKFLCKCNPSKIKSD